MNVEIEDVLGPLYEVELQSYLDDLPTDMKPEARGPYTEILVDSLTNIKNFMSSFGVTIEDFFNQVNRGMVPSEKSGKKGKGKSKGLPKGEPIEEPFVKGGKSQGKKGSTNKPKEPTLLGKPEEPIPPGKPDEPVRSKPKEIPVIVKTKPQGPPAKGGEPAPPVIPKEIAVPKATTTTAALSVQPAAEGQTKPPLKLASKTRTLDFSIPSKPEKPPAQLQIETTAQADDDDKDLQAALQASFQAPSSPQPPSGAQSSEPKPATDLNQQESELLTQLDRLMEESLRLESLPVPTIRDQSRIRSIATVASDIEMKVSEIAAQREEQAASKVRKTQEESVPAVKASATSTPSKAKEASVKMTFVAPPNTQPLTLDKLMAGIAQPGGPMLPVADSPKAQPQPMPEADRPKPQLQPRPIEDRPKAQSQSQAVSEPATMPIAPSLSAVPFPTVAHGKGI